MFQKEFDTSYVGFMVDGANWLVENTDIKLVGNAEILFFNIWAVFSLGLFSLSPFSPSPGWISSFVLLDTGTLFF